MKWPKCGFQTCDLAARTKNFCSAHYFQFKSGKQLSPIRYRSDYAVDVECNFESCERLAISRGFCQPHSYQNLKGLEMRPIFKYQETECSFESCDRKSVAKGLCQQHWKQKRNGNELKPIETRRKNAKCSYEGCDRKYVALGWCDTHYKQATTTGEVSEIRLQNGRSRDWHHNSSGYLVRYEAVSGRSKIIMQHREVVEQFIGRKLEGSENVHHVNGVRDDNRLENLELWSKTQPAGQRVLDKLEWARYIISKYEREQEFLESMGSTRPEPDKAGNRVLIDANRTRVTVNNGKE